MSNPFTIIKQSMKKSMKILSWSILGPCWGAGGAKVGPERFPDDGVREHVGLYRGNGVPKSPFLQIPKIENGT